jgi:hypothetical protein
MIKVFAVNDTEWYAGENLESCIKYFFDEIMGEPDTPESREEYGVDDAAEISEGSMAVMQFHDYEDEGETVRSFRDQLNLLVANGQTFPMMFATTEC